jgi:hypothetical protein
VKKRRFQPNSSPSSCTRSRRVHCPAAGVGDHSWACDDQKDVSARSRGDGQTLRFIVVRRRRLVDIRAGQSGGSPFRGQKRWLKLSKLS